MEFCLSEWCRMRTNRIYFLLAICLMGLNPLSSAAASRIKDIAAFEGVRDNQLVGYGLVVGLNGTGDRSQTFFPAQTLINMLERNGITIAPDRVRVKNIAAVMVTATLPPFIRQGSRIDVTVSSIGDAQSIQGGILIMTPLQAANSQVYVTAQGPVVLGGFTESGNGSHVQLNHPTVGRIPNGGLVEKDVAVDFSGRTRLNLVLNRSDFTTVSRAVHAINDSSGSAVASAIDGRTIAINVPADYSNRIIEFMSMIENASMEVDSPARVVINEKTGTIVLGKDVKISEVSIIHGSLSLEVGTVFNVSQPAPFSKGETKIVPETNISVQEEKGKTVMLREGASVEEVVRALNTIGAGPRDVIAILQAIKAQGALQAELEII
jgi:flagellar P-ring protein precursor FlgI